MMNGTEKAQSNLRSGSGWKSRGKDGVTAGSILGWDRRKAAPMIKNRVEFADFICMEKSVFFARTCITAIFLLALLPLAGCGPKVQLAADQPVPVLVRAPNHVRQPVSVAASGAVEANVTAQSAFQIAG